MDRGKEEDEIVENEEGEGEGCGEGGGGGGCEGARG